MSAKYTCDCGAGYSHPDQLLYCAQNNHGRAAPAPTVSESETYYTKGKDAEYFEKLSDKDFSWALTCASQDLNDSDENVSTWMPVSALLDGAADRIKKLSAAPAPTVSGEADMLEAGRKYEDNRKPDLIVRDEPFYSGAQLRAAYRHGYDFARALAGEKP